MASLGTSHDLCAAAAIECSGAGAGGDWTNEADCASRISAAPNGELPQHKAIGLALLFAYINRRPHVVDTRLFERDGDWRSTGVLNRTALHHAAFPEDLAMVPRLVGARHRPVERADDPFTTTAYARRSATRPTTMSPRR